MSNIFSLSGRTHADARRAKLDVVTAAMLNGGASGGWLMGRVLRPCDTRSVDRADAATATHTTRVELAGERATPRRQAA
jgi:hypothetical protein